MKIEEGLVLLKLEEMLAELGGRPALARPVSVHLLGVRGRAVFEDAVGDVLAWFVGWGFQLWDRAEVRMSDGSLVVVRPRKSAAGK